ncbi:MAG: hypothetical protein ABIO72_05825 [Patescibacteria group bacterium]
MKNLYTFDQLQAKAHGISIESAKAGEMFKAALMQQVSSSLAHEDNQEATFSAVRAVLEWKKAIEYAMESITVELKDTNPETLAEETLTP